jgi:hypothetical protein
MWAISKKRKWRKRKMGFQNTQENIEILVIFILQGHDQGTEPFEPI